MQPITFESLTTNFEGFFDKELKDIPSKKTALLMRSFLAPSNWHDLAEDKRVSVWDGLTEGQRREAVLLLDCQHDPVNHDEEEYWFNLQSELDEKRKKLAVFERFRPTSIIDMVSQESHVDALQQEMEQLVSCQC